MSKAEYSKIASIYNKYSKGITHKFESLDKALKEKFIMPLNRAEIVIDSCSPTMVASQVLEMHRK